MVNRQQDSIAKNASIRRNKRLAIGAMFAPEPTPDFGPPCLMQPARRFKAVWLSLALLPLVSACDYGGAGGEPKTRAEMQAAQHLFGTSIPQNLLETSERVADVADVIPAPLEARMTQQLADLEKRTGHQLVVATVPNLNGLTVNEYTLRLARHWGIGRKDYDDGALILLAPNEERIRVELGYGLECRISDVRAAQIIDAMMIHFRERNFSAGLDAGTSAMISELRAVPNDTRQWAKQVRSRAPSDPGRCAKT